MKVWCWINFKEKQFRMVCVSIKVTNLTLKNPGVTTNKSIVMYVNNWNWVMSQFCTWFGNYIELQGSWVYRVSLFQMAPCCLREPLWDTCLPGWNRYPSNRYSWSTGQHRVSKVNNKRVALNLWKWTVPIGTCLKFVCKSSFTPWLRHNVTRPLMFSLLSKPIWFYNHLGVTRFGVHFSPLRSYRKAKYRK